MRTGGPQDERSEPASVTAANELAADPRRRVFVIYLDTEHVGFEGSHAIKEPLIDLMTADHERRRSRRRDDADDEPVADHVRPPHAR